MNTVTLKQVPFTELRSLVCLGFDSDTELLNKYHILSGSSLDDCVEDTLNKIAEAAMQIELRYYAVMIDHERIGYIVVWMNGQPNYPDALYSFAININYRKPDILSSWFSSIRNLLSNNFIAVLWKKNTGAIKFLEKQGMVVFETNKETITLSNKDINKILCQ